ncbi:MAG: hypothetical protein R3Y13_00700 [bacterium]
MENVLKMIEEISKKNQILSIEEIEYIISFLVEDMDIASYCTNVNFVSDKNKSNELTKYIYFKKKIEVNYYLLLERIGTEIHYYGKSVFEINMNFILLNLIYVLQYAVQTKNLVENPNTDISKYLKFSHVGEITYYDKCRKDKYGSTELMGIITSLRSKLKVEDPENDILNYLYFSTKKSECDELHKRVAEIDSFEYAFKKISPIYTEVADEAIDKLFDIKMNYIQNQRVNAAKICGEENSYLALYKDTPNYLFEKYGVWNPNSNEKCELDDYDKLRLGIR